MAAFEQTPKGDLPTLYSVITGTKTGEADVKPDPLEALVVVTEAVEAVEQDSKPEAMFVDETPELPVKAAVSVEAPGREMFDQSAGSVDTK